MTNPNVVLMNDTDVDGYHFGCATVMNVIRTQLNSRGVQVAGSVPVSVDWRTDHADLVNSADVLVINGEGTLHHGSTKGRWLLEAGQSVKARGGRVVLINTIWQGNPSDWADLVKDADLICCRDSKSAAAISNQIGRPVRMIGDLSMSRMPIATTRDRSGIVFGDSVHAAITTALAERAKTIQGAAIVPVTSSLKFVAPRLSGLRRKLRQAYANYRQRQYLARNPIAVFVNDENSLFAVDIRQVA